MTVQSFPLSWPEGWPRTAPNRRTKSKFAATNWTQVEKLQRELRLLGASKIVISTNVPVRQDGLPYAEALRRNFDDPGVAIYFMLNGKPLAMARDAYKTPLENIRSLVVAIDAIRSIERHGGSVMMERAFAGFTAIPPPSSKNWWDILQVRQDASVEVIEANYRRLAKDRHPDNGGSNAAMSELNAARDEALRGRK